MEQQKQEFVAESVESKSTEIISRKEAKKIGLKRYFTGKTCKHGHIEERIVSSRSRVGCSRERARKERPKRREYFLSYCKSDDRKKRVKELSKKESYKSRKRERARELYSENKDKYRKKAMEKYWNGRERRLANKSKRCRGRASRDTAFALSCLCRNMVYRVLLLSSRKKENRTEVAIGYTANDLKQHIESKFKNGMTWENRSEWEIDHIKPVSLLIKEGVTDPMVINALDNLQPLWKSENRSKGAKYNA